MKRNQLIGIAVVVLVVLIGATFRLWLPIFVDDEVNEAFPFADMTEEEQAAFNALPEEQREAVLAMNEENPDMAAANARSMAQPDTEMAEDMPTAPTTLSQGTFNEIDVVHRGEGTATIYELPDGNNVLRLEDFRVTNGPQLHVLLTKATDPRSSADIGEDYIDLGALKGNVGNQNYDIPGDVDPSEYSSIVIYCMPFHVVFSVADLSETTASATPLGSEIRLMGNFQQEDPTPTEEVIEEEEPITLASGEFSGAGAGYSGSGGVTIIENPDGTRSVELDDEFTVSRGPELFVFLVNTESPSGNGGFGEEFVNLGRLIKRSGSQSYDIPEDVDLSLFNHVLIYCDPFTVTFSFAPLEFTARTGEFENLGGNYEGGGMVSITPQEDGTALVEFAEDFFVTDGPDLHVLLATGEEPVNSDALGDYIDIGALESPNGEQSYTVEAEDVDLSQYNTVVIYCVPFHVVFSYASLSEASE